MAHQKDKAVLAYSGGLDTSVCIKWLQEEKSLDVIAVVGDVGQEHEGLEKIKQKALKTGAVDCLVVDMRDDVRQRVPGQGACGQRHVREQVPARVGAVAAAHLQAPRGRRAQVRREVHRARLHGQGQRPGALRGEHPHARSGHRDPRPGARMGPAHPSRGDRLGASPTASTCPPRRNRRTPSTTTCGAGPSSAACSKIPGWSRLRTSTR